VKAGDGVLRISFETDRLTRRAKHWQNAIIETCLVQPAAEQSAGGLFHRNAGSDLASRRCSPAIGVWGTNAGMPQPPGPQNATENW
jgi:hypothetical protein